MSPRHLYLLLSLTLTLGACRSEVEDEKPTEKNYVPPGDTGLRVEEFEILYQNGKEQDDEGSFDADELRKGLYTQEDPGWRASIDWIPILGKKRVTFNELEWQRDLNRIRNFYYARGYYNVQIANQNVIRCERPDDAQDVCAPDEQTAKDGQAPTCKPQELSPKCDGELGKVYIRLVIQENKPTKVAAIRLLGTAQLGIPSGELLEEAPLRKGEVFEEERYLRTLDAVRNKLQERSYAYVEVTGKVIVDTKTNRAEVTVYVDPGPRTYFGPLRIDHPPSVEESYIRESILIKPCNAPLRDGTRSPKDLARCQPYSATEIQTAQRDLYDLGIFSLVNVQPAFSAAAPVTPQQRSASTPTNPAPQARGSERRGDVPDEEELQLAQPLGISSLLSKIQTSAAQRARLDPVVPINISLKEAKNWTVRLGAGAGIDLNARRDVTARATISSRNFLGLLGKMEFFNAAGYAWAGNDTLGVSNEGFIVTSELRYTQPRFFERKLELRLLGRIERDVQLGYKVLSPSGSIGLHREFFNIFELGASYNVSFYQYSNLIDVELREQLGAARDDTSPSLLLEYFEQVLIVGALDSPIDPTQGLRFEASLQEAADMLVGGEATYLRPRISIDGYIPFGGDKLWAVLAARASLGSIYNLSDSTADGPDQPIPFTSRLYGGGRGSVRSFGSRFLSYFSDSTRPIPIGAITLLEASVEPRFRVLKGLLGIGDLWVAPFLDVGSIQDRPFMLSTSDAGGQVTDLGELTSTLLYGVGGGVWWNTPVGPVRFDLAFNINDLSQDPRFSGVELPFYNFFIGIGHSF